MALIYYKSEAGGVYGSGGEEAGTSTMYWDFQYFYRFCTRKLRLKVNTPAYTLYIRGEVGIRD